MVREHEEDLHVREERHGCSKRVSGGLAPQPSCVDESSEQTTIVRCRRQMDPHGEATLARASPSTLPDTTRSIMVQRLPVVLAASGSAAMLHAISIFASAPVEESLSFYLSKSFCAFFSAVVLCAT
jgi:hypothetical protein